MSDPIVGAARKAVAGSADTLRRAAADLPAEALNWRPAGPDTNSIAVLAAHAMHATRILLTMAADLPPAPRDRVAEFAAVADGPDSVLSLVDGLAAECAGILDACEGVDWGTPRTRRRDDGSVIEMSAAATLFHAVEHLRGHADEASLTRHLWRAQHP